MNTRSPRSSRCLVGCLLVALLLVAGCGKRGPLYLPPDADKPKESAPTS